MDFEPGQVLNLYSDYEQSTEEELLSSSIIVEVREHSLLLFKFYTRFPDPTDSSLVLQAKEYIEEEWDNEYFYWRIES